MNDANCIQAQQFAFSSPYRYLSYYHILVCTISSTSIVLIVKMQKNVFPFHRNVKIILGIHLFYCFLQSSGYVAVHVADLIRLNRNHDNPCDYLLPTAYVFNFREVPVIGIYGEIVSLACISVERTCASLLEQYEKRKMSLFLTLLCVGQFLLVIGLFYVFLAVDVDWNSFVAAFNVRTESGAWKFKLIVYFGTILEIGSIVAFHVILYINKKRRDRLRCNAQQFACLSARFQITENVNAMNLLLPAIWMHFLVVSATGTALMFYDQLSDEKDKVATSTFTDATNIISFYPIFVAIFMFAKYSKARHNLFRKVADPALTVQPQKNEGDVHFAYLNTFIMEKPKGKGRYSSLKYLCCC
ncbi:hypothetical protein QR680_018001 [Steinernema hermaphroditum]|uniref:G-protein coupled receptors family 1 profile domain-containing protein n=1 Tax=Steinernema hermaphroditum TaxID=289476 RepID=A0AA39HHV3_9BILA|nr:hypothetical protein QR680_018001 [Steinernema hermaphroditum]